MFILFIYLIILSVLTFLRRNKVQNETDFYLAGGNISSFRLSFSLLATILGASSTIGLVAFSYKVGLPASFWLISGGLGLFILTLIYTKYPFGDKNYTFPEFLGKIYGLEVKKAVSIIILVTWIGVISAQILALSEIFQIFLPQMSPDLILALSVSVLIFYTASGGQSAVILTDLIQFVFLISGIVALDFILLFKAGFSFSSVSPEYLRLPLNSYFKFQDFIYFLVILSSVYLIGPDIHSRLFCTVSVKVKKRALIITAILLVPLGFIISLAGIFAHNYFTTSLGDRTLPVLINIVFHSRVLVYLFLLSLLSALFSSADTCLLTAATIFVRDILNFKVDRSILLTRMFIFLIGITALLIGVYFKDIIAILLLSYSIYTAGVLVPFLLIPYRGKLGLKKRAVFLSIISGGGLALLLNMLRLKNFIYFAYLLSVAVLFLLSKTKDK